MTNISPGYIQFLRDQNELLRQRNADLWKANDSLWERVDHMEFDARRLVTEILDLKHQFGYFDQVSEDLANAAQQDDFADNPF